MQSAYPHGRLFGVIVEVGPVDAKMQNPIYQGPKVQVGGAHFGQHDKTALLSIVYKMFQFISVDYGDR